LDFTVVIVPSKSPSFTHDYGMQLNPVGLDSSIFNDLARGRMAYIPYLLLPRSRKRVFAEWDVLTGVHPRGGKLFSVESPSVFPAKS
jgi:hypothetical protein